MSDINSRKNTFTYSNMTKGQHDDFVSSAYFAVADITLNSVEEAANYYDDNNLLLVTNKNNNIKSLNRSFY